MLPFTEYAPLDLDGPPADWENTFDVSDYATPQILDAIALAAPAEPMPTTLDACSRSWLEDAAAKRIAGTKAKLGTGDRGLEWKWHGLNTRIDTFCRGDLAVFMHPTGGGKSTTADNLAESWAELGEEIMVFSTEESVEDKSMKMACRKSGVRYGDAKRNRVRGGWLRRLNQAVEAQSRHPLNKIHYYDSASPTARETAKVIRKGAAAGITTFILDHLDVFETVGKKSDWQEKKAFVKFLKNLAVTLKVRILLLVQVMAEQGSGPAWRHKCPSTKNGQGGQGPSHYADIVVAGYQPFRAGVTGDDIMEASLTPEGVVALVEKNTIVYQVLKFREGLRAEHTLPLACWVVNNEITERDMANKQPPAESAYEKWRKRMGETLEDPQTSIDEDDRSVPDLEPFVPVPF